MSASYIHLEQDAEAPDGGNDLPTYDDLASQNGPNSRFGRWRGWIEKRAAERYNDLTPDVRARQRERGWDLPTSNAAGRNLSSPLSVDQRLSTPLHVDTNFESSSSTYPDYDILPEPSPPLPPLPSVIQDISPSHLKLKQFGSRFLPHTTSPIRCLLPLPSNSLVLIGHDDGLSVLDMYPQDMSEDGVIIEKGPDEAQARAIWTGEGVIQMTILEVENNGIGNTQGVVLALVEPESATPKEGEGSRALRMYNLTSLISLAKWAVGYRISRPLDLRRPTNWNVQQTPSKKHRPQTSIARGLRNLIDSPSNNQSHSHSHSDSTASYQNLLSRTSSLDITRHPTMPGEPIRANSDETWDLVDDLPLRWATDFVPLATAGSRLTNTSVLSYAVWQDESRKAGQLLAVATKSNIFLYETPRGERAFRFVKEFYTPLQPKSITFFHQIVQDISRAASTNTKALNPRQTHEERRRSASFTPVTLNYGPQLSLFVIFDKKAGWIRLADSAVGEVDLYDDGTYRDSIAARRSIRSSIAPEIAIYGGKWVPPVQCQVPSPLGSKKLCVLTRGKVSHVLPSPLPSTPSPPLFTVAWKYVPTSVSVRVYDTSVDQSSDSGPISYLQFVGLGDDGLEVQEIPLSFMSKGKGKAKADEAVIRAEEDLMGSAAFLCSGGNWHDPSYERRSRLERSQSVASSVMSFDTMDTEEMQVRMKQEEGLYFFCRRGIQDYRVVWVGGS